MQKSKQEHSYWNIYFSGHGSSVFQTAGITENSFKDLLYFFEHDTKIRSLYYSSCYTGGVISKAIFGTSSYSYPIFTEGLENTVYAQNVSAIFKHLMDISPINKNSWQKLAQHSYLRSPYSLLSAREPGKSSFSTILVAVDRFYTPYNGEVKTFTSLRIFPLNETIKQEDLDKFEYNPDASQLPELYVLETTRFSPTLSF